MKSGKIEQGSSAATNAKKPGFNNNNKNKKKEGEGKQLPPCHNREDINDNISPITDCNLLMLQMLCRPTLRMLLGHQLHIDLHLHNNAYQFNTGGQNFNQAHNQGYGQRSNQGERMVKFTPIPMAYTKLLPNPLKSALVAICPARPYNHHIPDIMMSMLNVNIMVERLFIQLRIVEASSIKCNPFLTRGVWSNK